MLIRMSYNPPAMISTLNPLRRVCSSDRALLHMRRGITAVSSTVFFLSAVAVAAVFPDVPESHVHREAIEQLVSVKVINGNPDGNFYPERSVNRAEILKMLFLASGLEPDANQQNCFPDVPNGSWFESFVCDASIRRFVQGYADGTFRPAAPVNRVEALKMIHQVFGLTVVDVTDAHRDLIKFVDVSTSAWYTKYIYGAYVAGVLPIPGQNPSRFFPEQDLLRDEAAALIFNAITA